MLPELFSDPRLQKVVWRDLLKLNRREIITELFISLPWLFFSCLAAYFHLLVPALLSSFLFFLTGLRQSHNAQHYAVGISKRATEWFLCIISLSMMASMHAVKYNHLVHHKSTLAADDVEAMSAKMKWWKAILAGPYFIIMLHANAFLKGNKNIRHWIILELAANAILVYTAFFLFDIYWLQYHVTVMLTGECFTSFFAVWTVHHDCEKTYLFARTIRGKLKGQLFYNMFYHMEHHLFPKVPTCHMEELAKRIDTILPEIKTKSVF